MIYRAEQGIFRSELLDRLDWLNHGFGTRHSTPWQEPEPKAVLKQIHSTVVHQANSPELNQLEGDGLTTRTPGLWLGIKTADCVPVLLADAKNHAIGALHAGWRGAAHGILASCLQQWQSTFESRPADIFAAVGPSIGGCCYEVGPEVSTLFQQLFPERPELSGVAKIDLREAIRRQLEAAGVPPGHIDTAQMCTQCEPEWFYSFRRERDLAGRMFSAIRIKDL